MAQSTQKHKRRGVILLIYGWQRLQDAQEQLAITKNEGYACTLEQLSALMGLSVRSITRLQKCKIPVDRQTLEEFGGIGKTTLSVKLAEQVQDHFTYVVWHRI